MEAACDGDVFRPTNLVEDPVMLNIDSTAVVRNVAIFQHFLLNWKIWEKAEQGVLEMLLATIDILVHGSHSYYEFNIIQFQKAQLVQQILIGCQVSLAIVFGFDTGSSPVDITADCQRNTEERLYRRKKSSFFLKISRFQTMLETRQ